MILKEYQYLYKCPAKQYVRIFHDYLVKTKLEQESQLKKFSLYPHNCIYGTFIYDSGACWRSGQHQGPCSGAAGKWQSLQGCVPLQIPRIKQNIGDHNGLSCPKITA